MECVNEKSGTSSMEEGMSCGMAEMVKCNNLKWFGHLERTDKGMMTRRIYTNQLDGVSVTGQHPVK